MRRLAPRSGGSRRRPSGSSRQDCSGRDRRRTWRSTTRGCGLLSRQPGGAVPIGVGRDRRGRGRGPARAAGCRRAAGGSRASARVFSAAARSPTRLAIWARRAAASSAVSAWRVRRTAASSAAAAWRARSWAASPAFWASASRARSSRSRRAWSPGAPARRRGRWWRGAGWQRGHQPGPAPRLAPLADPDEGGDQRRQVRIAVAGGHGQRPVDHGPHGAGQIGQPDGGQIGAGGPGRGDGRAAQRFQQGDGEAVLVAARVGGLAPGLLGRHVTRGPSGHHRLAHGDGHRQAEVGHPHASVPAHQHVVRLEVAVDDARRVGRLQTVGRRQEDLEDLVGGAPAYPQPAAQGHPVDPLEREEVGPAVRHHLVQGHHVGVVQPGQGPRFGDPGLVGRQGRLVALVPGPQLLEGDRPLQLLVVGVVDHAHSARAEHPADEEPAHPIAGAGAPAGPPAARRSRPRSGAPGGWGRGPPRRPGAGSRRRPPGGSRPRAVPRRARRQPRGQRCGWCPDSPWSTGVRLLRSGRFWHIVSQA